MADEVNQPLDEELDPIEEPTPTGADTAQLLASKDKLIEKLRKEAANRRVTAKDAIAEADALKTQLAKVDTVTQTVEQMKAELEAEKTARKQAELQNLRLQVATSEGLPPELASRLSGATLEELQADAKALVSIMPKGALVVPRVGQGAEQPLPSRAKQIHARISGTSSDVFNPDTNLQFGGGIFKGD